MTFDVTDLRLAGIDERNITTVNEYEAYLKTVLPASEPIRDMFIDVDEELLLSDLYFFTGSFMIEVPDFVTFYDGKFHPKVMTFTIHPVKDGLHSLSMKIVDAKGSGSRTVEVKFEMKTGTTFRFSEMKENAVKLEYIAKTYLVPNLGRG